MNPPFRIGVDLGGTKTEVVVLAGDGVPLFRRRRATPAHDYAATLDLIADLVAEAERETGPASVIGIGTPGSLSPVTGTIRNANSTCLNGHRLDRDLEARLRRSVRLDNDANCFAMAEAHAGAGRGHALVLGVILGTGIGAGIVHNGRVLQGANKIAGEWGHNPLPAPGSTVADSPAPPCYCGRTGCIEAWCSGPAVAAEYQALGGVSINAEDIAARALAGETLAEDVLERHRLRLGRALAGVVNILDPDVIVLGGGLSGIDSLCSGLAEAMRPHIFSDTFATPVIRNALGDSAGVIGAAWLVDELQAQGAKHDRDA